MHVIGLAKNGVNDFWSTLRFVVGWYDDDAVFQAEANLTYQALKLFLYSWIRDLKSREKSERKIQSKYCGSF